MDFLFQAFIGTFIVTFSFIVLSATSVGKEKVSYPYETATVLQDEENEEVSYEELNESVSIESLKQKDNQINVRYTKVS